MPTCPHCFTTISPARIMAKFFLQTDSLLYTCTNCTGQSQHQSKPLISVLLIFGTIFGLNLWLISHPGWLVIYSIAAFIALWLALAYLPLEKIEPPTLTLVKKKTNRNDI